MKNYSRQREAILEYVCSVKTHPTAKEVYDAVKEKIPNISLGTVYRNLSELAKSGNILSLNVGDGFERFDGDISTHIHLHCEKCGTIIDISPVDFKTVQFVKAAEFTPCRVNCVINGICKNCAKQSNK